jgi:RsiW-degrading membrane proteinase PrsW (M82 family)
MSLPSMVYLLCIATSAACMVLLIRGYRQSRARLLLWSALCFVGLAVNNLLLFIDVIVLPTEIDLQPVRHLASLAAVSVLLYGFIWETD